MLSELVDDTLDQQIWLIFIDPHASEHRVDAKIRQDRVPNQLSEIPFHRSSRGDLSVTSCRVCVGGWNLADKGLELSLRLDGLRTLGEFQGWRVQHWCFGS